MCTIKASSDVEKLLILGSDGYGNTVGDIAEQLDYEILAVLDDKDLTHPLNLFTSYIAEGTLFIPAFGNNEFRLSWVDKLSSSGAKLATLLHPTAYISPKATINPGVVILPHAVVNTDTIIERGCIVNIGALIDHGCVIEEGCHICCDAIVKRENRISRLTKIETGQVVEVRTYPV